MFKISSSFQHKTEIEHLKEKIFKLEKENLELHSNLTLEREQNKKITDAAKQKEIFIGKLSDIVFKVLVTYWAIGLHPCKRQLYDMFMMLVTDTDGALISDQ